MPRRNGVKGPKKIAYTVIAKDSDAGIEMYPILDELVADFHDDLYRARIVCAWCTSWKPDPEGHVTIGKCKRASDLDRELANYDFVILLSQFFWTTANAKQRRALLDHELCHAAVKYDDASGDPAQDARGRTIYRTRKHDIEEFQEIVARHGCYKRDLEAFAKALIKSRQGALPLGDSDEDPPAPPAPPTPITH